jgi:hypothetical protein
MATDSLNASEILANFREWSTDEQLMLIRSLIGELANHGRNSRSRLSVYDLAGIAARPVNTPSNEQIAAWLDERRMKEAQ